MVLIEIIDIIEKNPNTFTNSEFEILKQICHKC